VSHYQHYTLPSSTKIYSAINQQIALKTIRKLGFEVTAVWNGKEAIDYLSDADSPEPPHPKPDIILMDVQMPIIDGYLATHLIRHHAPYNISARNIPIVAMTASAIQGDREKCKKAGMDDYLAKPVKAKTLEKMLVRWAISRRMPRTPATDSEESECSESEAHDCGPAALPLFGQRNPGGVGSSKSSKSSQMQDPPRIQTSRPTMKERQNSHSLTLPGTESEGDRAERREEAEEKATSLRDEKLVEAASSHGERLVPPHGEVREQRQKLTMENVGKLEREVESGGNLRSSRPGGKRKSESMGMGMGDNIEEETETDGKETKERRGDRPKMERRWMDSERTVTGREDD
jgi:CheY-like chemotaxis protein